jgi:NADH dehydrogenase FAD-containing subunit
VLVVFFLPVQYFILSPQIANTMVELDPSMTEIDAKQELENNFTTIIVGSIIMHLIFGVTVGFFSSVLSIKFGTRYRCSQCDISFSRIDSYRKHNELVHGIKPIQLIRILILGGGFAGIEVLNRLQKAFQDDVRVDITLVSRDNFFLFTPMLPEVSSGSIETRHIVTPIRTFCKRARFIEANIEEINLKYKQVIVSHKIDQRDHVLEYDYLTIAHDENDAKIILINSSEKLLPEAPAELADFTLQKLSANGIEVRLNTRVSGASSNNIVLSNGSTISSHTLIWAGGVKPDLLVTKINNCEHDQKSGKVISNSYLELKGWNNVFAIGDCAYIMDPNTDRSYPPTAQHAIRQAKVAAENMISDIRQKMSSSVVTKSLGREAEKFDYQTKGIMALIGNRNGVGVVFGYKVHGILAWWLWRMYYLGNLPSMEKRFRVMIDWIIDILFKRDVTRLRVTSEGRSFLSKEKHVESH